jgi:hypothetical protein
MLPNLWQKVVTDAQHCYRERFSAIFGPFANMQAHLENSIFIQMLKKTLCYETQFDQHRHKIPQLLLILSQLHSVYTCILQFCIIQFNISLPLHLGLSNSLLS